MIASSPTSAALVRSTANCSPSTGFSSHPHRYDHPASQNTSFPAPPPSPKATRTARARTDSGGASGVEEIRSALRRQTVDAGTQYSRPPSPTNGSKEHTSFPGQSRLTEPNNPTTDSSTQIRGGDNDVTSRAGMQMPATSAARPKRNTPDTSTVLASVAPADTESSGGKSPTESLSKRLRQAKPAPKPLPARYEEANTRDLVVLISSMLMELIRFNDKIPLRDGSLTRFHSRSPPRISVPDYLQRLTTHATLSPPILLSMVYYIDRLCVLYPAFTISSLTVHRFLISSATVASKGLSDSFWTNKTYARVGGISVAELALLELELLWRLEWRIVPDADLLVEYYESLVARCDDYVIQKDDDEKKEPAKLPGTEQAADNGSAPGS